MSNSLYKPDMIFSPTVCLLFVVQCSPAQIILRRLMDTWESTVATLPKLFHECPKRRINRESQLSREFERARHVGDVTRSASDVMLSIEFPLQIALRVIILLQSPQDQAGHIYPKATSSQCRPPRSLHATRRYCRPRPDSHIPPDNYCSSVKSSVLEMHYTYCANQCQSGIILFRWIVLDLPIHRSNSPLEAWINITIFYRGISCSAMFDHFLNSHKDSTECNWWILDFFTLENPFLWLWYWAIWVRPD